MNIGMEGRPLTRRLSTLQCALDKKGVFKRVREGTDMVPLGFK